MNNISKSDPNNINIDSNVQVTQGHIDKLFDGVGPVLDKYHKDNPLMCDSECRANKKEDAYYNIYLAAQENLQKAPEEYEEAEKNFYVLSDSGQSYANFKENQAIEQVGKISQILEGNFKGKVENIKDKLTNYKSLKISEKHLEELQKSYETDIHKMDQEISRRRNDTNVNDRLSVYYSRQIVSNKNILFYVKSFYWFILTIFICYFLIYRKMFRNKKKIILAVLLFIFPFIIRSLVSWIYPIQIKIPPPEPVCPTKKAPTIIATPTTKSPTSEVTWKPTDTTPTEICPTPSLWDAFISSVPHIGHGPTAAKRGIENKVSDLKDYITNIF